MSMKMNKLIFFIVLSLVQYNFSNILTLSEAEEKTLTVSYDIRSMYFERKSKEWLKFGASTQYLPKVNYSGNFTRSKLNVTTPFGTQPMYLTSFNNTLSINQPISNGGAEIIALRIAKHSEKAAILQQDFNKQEILFATRKAYYDAVSALEFHKTALFDLSWSKNNLIKAQTRYDAGHIPETELLQWKAEVSQKESNLVEAKALADFTKMNLLQSIGDPDIHKRISLEEFTTFEKKYNEGLKILNDSAASNPLIQSLEELKKVSHEYKNIEITGYIPKVNGFFSLSKDIPRRNKEFKQDDVTWNIGLQLNLPIFDGMQSFSNIKKAKAEYQKQVIETQKQKSAIQLNLDRIKLFYKASYENVKAASEQVKLMEKQLSLMEERYDGGLVNQSQLLEVALRTNQSKLGYIQKLFTFLLYEAEYLKNAGTLEVTK